MKPLPNYYKLIGVPSSATPEEITQAFRKKILQVHLDKLPTGEDSSVCYSTIEAYRVLSNRETRKLYDIKYDKEKRNYNFNEGSVDENSNSSRSLPAICFDTQDQLSKKILADIKSWETEFTPETVSDNYFQCYSQIFEKALKKSSTSVEGDSGVFWCKLCDKMFQCEKQHWDEVLLPYVNTLCDPSVPQGETALYDFLYYEFGKDFLFKSEELPKALNGFWSDAKDWSFLSESCHLVESLVRNLTKYQNYKSKEDYIQYLHIALSEHPNLSELMSWTMENSSLSTIDIQAKTQQLFAQNDIEMLFKFIAVLKEFKEINVWESLREEAFLNNEFNLCILWNKVLEIFDPTSYESWLELGLRIQNLDASYAHLCYLIGNYDMKTIADELTQRKLHYDSITYHLNFSEPSTLLTTFRELSELGRIDEANIYRNVFYASKIKKLLLSIIQQQAGTDSKGIEADVEELIHICLLLFPDEIENNLPLKIIICTYPQLFGSFTFEKIHSKVIEDHQSIYSDNRLTFQLLKRPIAACHFLSSEGIQYFEPYIRQSYNLLLQSDISKCISSCDYEGLTNVLLRLNNRSLDVAQAIIENSGSTQLNPSMKLLIRGTIHKIQRNWLGCTSDYQEALFSTPECMYRLIPCISKLSQDTSLHNGVINEVENVIQHFKNSFDSGEYIQVNGVSNHSLVVTTGTPEQDFGYKDLISRIQIVDRQAEQILPREDQPAPDPTMDFPHVEQDQVTLEKFEAAIEEPNNNEQSGDPITAALSYIDLVQVLPENLRQGPLVMASSHFLRGMKNTADPSKLYAYRNSILKLAEMLFGNTNAQESALNGCLTHKYLFSIILQANQLLSKAIPIEDAKEKEQLISSNEQILIEKLFQSVVKITKIEPLVNIPILSCGDLSYVEKVKTHFLHQFCMDKTKEKYESSKTPRYIHAFTTFLEVANGRNRKCDFDLARFTAIETFLKQHNWKMEDMTEFMSWSPICIDEDGFTSTSTTELMYPDYLKKFERIDGFNINYETGEISFLLAQGKPIFTEADIIEIFSFKFPDNDFNCYVDIPDADMALHPCQLMHYEPASLQGTEVLKLLVRCTNLITYFASGLSMSCYPPFMGQPMDAGILKRLPEHLQYFLRPLKERARTITRTNANHSTRFRLILSEVEVDMDDSNEMLQYQTGNAKVELTYDSNLIQDQELSPEVSFAADFSSNFDELVNWIPEFRKLKEIFKLIVIAKKLSDIQHEIENSTDPEILNIAPNICSSINMLGINYTKDQINEIQKSGFGIIPSTNTTGRMINEFNPCSSITFSPSTVLGPVSFPNGSNAQIYSAHEFWTQPCETNGLQSSNFYCATSYVVDSSIGLAAEMEMSDLILNNMSLNSYQWKQTEEFVPANLFDGWQTEKKQTFVPFSITTIDNISECSQHETLPEDGDALDGLSLLFGEVSANSDAFISKDNVLISMSEHSNEESSVSTTDEAENSFNESSITDEESSDDEISISDLEESSNESSISDTESLSDESSITDTEESSDKSDSEDDAGTKDEIDSVGETIPKQSLNPIVDPNSDSEVPTSSMEIILESNEDSEVSEFSLPEEFQEDEIEEERISKISISNEDNDSSGSDQKFFSESNSTNSSAFISVNYFPHDSESSAFEISSEELDKIVLNDNAEVSTVESIDELDNDHETDVTCSSVINANFTDFPSMVEHSGDEIFETNIERIFIDEMELILGDFLICEITKIEAEVPKPNHDFIKNTKQQDNFNNLFENNIEQLYFEDAEFSFLPNFFEPTYNLEEVDKDCLVIVSDETSSEISIRDLDVETLSSSEYLLDEDEYNDSDCSSTASSSSLDSISVFDELFVQSKVGIENSCSSQSILVVPCSIAKDKDEFVWLSESSSDSESDSE